MTCTCTSTRHAGPNRTTHDSSNVLSLLKIDSSAQNDDCVNYGIHIIDSVVWGINLSERAERQHRNNRVFSANLKFCTCRKLGRPRNLCNGAAKLRGAWETTFWGRVPPFSCWNCYYVYHEERTLFSQVIETQERWSAHQMITFHKIFISLLVSSYKPFPIFHFRPDQAKSIA
jgi:hypothetical protein